MSNPLFIKVEVLEGTKARLLVSTQQNGRGLSDIMEFDTTDWVFEEAFSHLCNIHRAYSVFLPVAQNGRLLEDDVLTGGELLEIEYNLLVKTNAH